MAVRPPDQDTDDPDIIEFGIAALDARLEEADLEFPATSEEILAALDNEEIPADGSGHTLALSEALDSIPRDRFESETELLNTLHPVFEEYRASRANSILGQLRRLLPF